MDINGYFSSFPEYVYLGFSLPLLLFFAVRNRHRAGHDFSKWIHFYGHSVVWITSLTLFMVQLFEIAEGIMQEQLQPGIEPSLYIPDVLAVFSTVLSLVIFNYGEHHSSILWPCLSLLYWLASSIVDLWQLINCISLNGSFNQSQPLLNLATLVLKTSLFGLYAFLIIYQKWYQSKESQAARQNLFRPNLTYIQPLVCLLSKATWSWLTQFLQLGFKRVLTIKDLGSLPETEDAEYNFKKLKAAYDAEKIQQHGHPSLWRVFWRAYWPMILLGGFYKLLADQLIYVPPILLDHMVTYVVDQIAMKQMNARNNTNVTLPDSDEMLSFSQFISNGYVLALVAFITTILQATMIQNHFYISSREGARCKVAMQTLVFDKSLRLSQFGLNEGKMTTGQILNHMSVDPLNLFFFFFVMHSAWSLPFQVLTGFVLLYHELGLCALVSGLLIVLMVPVQYCIGHRLGHYQKETMEQADVRLKKVNEVFQNIKYIKLSALESIFEKSILDTRKKELIFLLKAALCRIACITVTDGIPVVATVLTFCLYPYFESEPLKASKVFSVLALFNILAIPLFVITLVINTVSHAVVSVNRLHCFLAAPEVEEDALSREEKQDRKRSLENNDVHFKGPFLKNGFADTPDIVVTCDDITSNHTSRSTTALSKTDYMTNVEDGSSKESLIENRDTSLSTLPAHDASCGATPLVSEKIDSGEFTVEISDGNFAWDTEGKEAVLKDINIKIPQGKLTLVVGEVGSGKSSLLSALIGEMVTISGQVTRKRWVDVAYVSQKAWLTNTTIRENVLFGKEFDAELYDEVVRKCALEPDFAMLPAGDRTQIGEKGVSLSGGQKQRVNLARALYSRAHLVLMDDPISALDAHVGSHVFEEAIEKFLIKEHHQTVVLVTHHVHYLPHADWIIFLESGAVSFQGTLNSLQSEAPSLYKSWRSSLLHTSRELSHEDKTKSRHHHSTVPHLLPESLVSGTPRAAASISSLTCPSLFDESVDSDTFALDEPEKSTFNQPALTKGELDEEDKGRLIADEEQETGVVALKYYLAYARAAGFLVFITPIALYTLRQALRMGSDFWLAEWMEVSHWWETHHHANQTAAEMPGAEYYAGVYAAIQVVALVALVLSIMTLEGMALLAARNLLSSMLKNLIAAPIRFFDTTPIGRIINRFAGDTQTIDERLAVNFDQVLFCVLYVLGGVVVNAVSNAFFLVPLVPVILAFLMVQRFYITSCRELQRLESVTRSPVLSHFSETLNGLSTIRAYRFAAFALRMALASDHLLKVWNEHYVTSKDYLGGCIVLAASMCSITAGLHGTISPSIVGLGIAYSIVISTFLNWAMRGISETEMFFNSVERVTHYTSIPTEPSDGHDLASMESWPSQGGITFEGVYVRYDKHLDPVLKDINLNIKPGEHVGICGRTGSGKSSLTLSLFRMVDVFQGRILIDGKDISEISLHALRSQLSIIPQDPVLFFGSVRHNLDTSEKRSDDELWNALEIAQLKSVIDALPDKLDTVITEGGENLSVGQRQLFCLARAFLQHSQILILDEATSSIDMATDRLIQRVMQTAFKGKTIVTVAHRVSSILHCDTILVLSNGEIIERGSPSELQEKPQSTFAAMLRQNQM